MEKISTVIFDLGRVLVDIDFEAFPNALELTTPEMRAPYVQEAALIGRLYETGKLSTGEFLDRFYILFGKRYTREHLLSAWNEIIREDVPGMTDLIARVQRRAATAMLSNTSSSHFLKAERTCETVRMIPRRFLSYEIGAAKPDAEIYLRTIATLGVPASEIVFIDDLKENIDGAVRAGMHGIVFSDITRLELDLSRLNILNSAHAE